MIEIFHWLMETEGFNPKVSCGYSWSTAHAVIHCFANIVGGVVYQIIPMFIAWWIIPRHVPEFRPALWGFVLFVSTCGLTHFMEALSVYYPVYRLVTASHILNMWVSLAGLVWIGYAATRIKYHAPDRQISKEAFKLRRLAMEIARDAEEILKRNGPLEARSRLNLAIGKLQQLKG